MRKAPRRNVSSDEDQAMSGVLQRAFAGFHGEYTEKIVDPKKSELNKEKTDQEAETGGVHLAAPGRPDDSSWTDEDELSVLEEWSDHRKHWVISDGLSPHYLALWKDCFAFMRSTRWDIIGSLDAQT